MFIDPQRVGKWCTTFQLSMVIAILLSPNLPPYLSLLPKVLWVTASVLAIAAIIQYYRIGRSFLAQYEATIKKKNEGGVEE